MSITKFRVLLAAACSVASLCLTVDVSAQKLTSGAQAYEVSRVGVWRSQGCTDCGSVVGCDCGCDTLPPGHSPAMGSGEMGMGEMGSGAPDSGMAAQDFGLLAGNYGATSEGPGNPYMIGDFFGGGSRISLFGTNNTISTAGGDRIFKWSDNNSAFPQDRIFFNYHYFKNAVVDVDGNSRSVNRFTFGVEKTFLNDIWSVEFRAPFALGLAGTQRSGADTTDAQFGNMALALKRLVYQNSCTAIAVGCGFSFPTAQDVTQVANGATLEINNESVHVLPFMGIYYAPYERIFTQFFAQLDFDTVGSSYFASGGFLNTGGESGVIQDATQLSLDWSIGYWLYRHDCSRWITGMAPMFEVHYATTITDIDSDASGQIFVADNDRTDTLHLTAGVFLELGDLHALQIGAVSPVREDLDKFFDAEFGMQYIRRF